MRLAEGRLRAGNQSCFCSLLLHRLSLHSSPCSANTIRRSVVIPKFRSQFADRALSYLYFSRAETRFFERLDSGKKGIDHLDSYRSIWRSTIFDGFSRMRPRCLSILTFNSFMFIGHWVPPSISPNKPIVQGYLNQIREYFFLASPGLGEIITASYSKQDDIPHPKRSSRLLVRTCRRVGARKRLGPSLLLILGRL
jgi:hypothetical protein